MVTLPPLPDLQLTADSARSPVSARIGQRLRIALNETRTTGYQWRLVAACEALLQLESDEFESPDRKPGAPGRHIWTFPAERAGTCQVTLQASRSWEAAATGSTVTFDLSVGP